MDEVKLEGQMSQVVSLLGQKNRVNVFLRIPLSYFLIILIFFCCGVFTLAGLFTLENHNRELYEHPFTVSKASLQVALYVTKMHRDMKDVVLSDSSGEIESIVQELEEKEKYVYSQLSIISQYILGEEGSALERNAEKLFTDWKPIRDKVFRYLESGDREKAVSITKKEGAEHVEKLEDQAVAMTAYAAGKAAEILSGAESEQKMLKDRIVVLSLVSVLVSVFISFFATSLVLKAEGKVLNKNDLLQKAVDEVKTLRKLLPICSYCKKIKGNDGKWEVVEEYIRKISDARFTHGICRDCYEKELEKIKGVIQ